LIAYMDPPRFARTSSCDSSQDHDCTHIYGLLNGGHVCLLALMDSALSLLNSLTTFDGLCDKQGLGEPVIPVLPSLRYCPRNRLVGAHICNVSLLYLQATSASDVTRRDDSGPPSLIMPRRPGPSCSLGPRWHNVSRAGP